MPATSSKQYKFLAGLAHGMKSNKKNKNNKNKSVGPSEEVAEEMVSKTPPKMRSLFMKKKKK